MEPIHLTTSQGNSKILIKEGLFEKSGELLKKEYPESKFAIITDSNIKKIYGEKLKSIFPKALIISVPAGEESKELKNAIGLAEKLLSNGFTRSDVVIGFGGGMVTDLAGFVSSVYMRGMKYIAIPTSLLGMVDAAIGGKTAINLGAKNIIGTFYLADYVLIDPNFLKSFPDQKQMPGMGEIVKYGAIIDKTIIADLKKESLDLSQIIIKSVNAKMNIVSQDLKESGIRKILNYGHTFGHAIETAMNYKLSHDQSISIGMVIANKVAQNLGKQDENTGKIIKETLESMHLPTELPEELLIENLIGYILKDKKRHGDVIDFVIVPELGHAEIVSLKPEELIELAK